MPRYPLTTLKALGALRLVADERTRQALPVGDGGEGRSATADDAQVHGQLADAAASYATTLDQASRQTWPFDWGHRPRMGLVPSEDPAEVDRRVTDLVRAGALILAELDRLARTGVA